MAKDGSAVEYQDRWITCTGDGLSIRGYYFPWGTKRIPYTGIRKVRRVPLSWVRGRARIWGTTHPRYWANLDPTRPRKHVGLVLDVGALVSPLVTPDDPDRVEELIREHAGLAPDTDGETGPTFL